MTEEPTRRQKKLGQIRALIDKADATTFPEEKEALLRKADDLMLAYAVSEHEIDALKPSQERQKPEMTHVKVCEPNSIVKDQLINLFEACVAHCRSKAVYTGMGSKTAGSTATVIGFPSDLEYLEMIFTSLRLQMATNLEPRPDASLSEEENVALMKEAGMKWQRIFAVMRPGEPWERRHGVRYTKLYTDFCASTGRERMYTAPTTYARNFADGFARQVSNRFYDIQQRQKVEEVGGTGTGLMLRDRSMDVLDAFNDMFGGKVKFQKQSKGSEFVDSANRAGRQAGDRADLGQSRVGSRKELPS